MDAVCRRIRGASGGSGKQTVNVGQSSSTRSSALLRSAPGVPALEVAGLHAQCGRQAFRETGSGPDTAMFITACSIAFSTPRAFISDSSAFSYAPWSTARVTMGRPTLTRPLIRPRRSASSSPGNGARPSAYTSASARPDLSRIIARTLRYAPYRSAGACASPSGRGHVLGEVPQARDHRQHVVLQGVHPGQRSGIDDVHRGGGPQRHAARGLAASGCAVRTSYSTRSGRNCRAMPRSLVDQGEPQVNIQRSTDASRAAIDA